MFLIIKELYYENTENVIVNNSFQHTKGYIEQIAFEVYDKNYNCG
ncbi:hypothetical protein FACS189499_09540 [Clostridia bacterium]|nr:hypothetical protein FACS189499_09540 [Clostridia bacterium]